MKCANHGIIVGGEGRCLILLWPYVVAQKRAANADNDTCTFPRSRGVNRQAALESQGKDVKEQELHSGDLRARRLVTVMNRGSAIQNRE